MSKEIEEQNFKKILKAAYEDIKLAPIAEQKIFHEALEKIKAGNRKPHFTIFPLFKKLIPIAAIACIVVFAFVLYHKKEKPISVSHVDLSLQSGKIIKLYAGTVHLKKGSTAKFESVASQSDKNAVVELEQGEIEVTVIKNKGNITIKTPAGKAHAIGTHFFVKYEKSKQGTVPIRGQSLKGVQPKPVMTVAVISGSVEVSNIKGNAIAEANETVVAEIDSAPEKQETAKPVKKHKKITPNPRYGHSAIYDPLNKQMLIFGGYNLKYFLSDTWAYDIEKNEWKKIAPAEGSGMTKNTPPARYNHSAIYDSANKQMVIFGGQGEGKYLSDTWVFDIEKSEWKEIEGEESPPARDRHSAIYDPVKKQMLIFGGMGTTERGNQYLADLWSYDTEKMLWEEMPIKKTLKARAGHSAVYIEDKKEMMIFGGNSPVTYMADTWFLNTENMTWEEVITKEGPEPREQAFVIYEPIDKEVMLFGGYNRTGWFADIWIIDIDKKNWEEIKVEKPLAERSGHSAVYDSTNRQIIVFGGMRGNKYLSNILIYDIRKEKWKKMKIEK